MASFEVVTIEKVDRTSYPCIFQNCVVQPAASLDCSLSVVKMKALQRYVRPQVVETWSPTQIAEYYNSTDHFYCPTYGTLQRKLAVSNLIFKDHKNLDAKKRTAGIELQLWDKFVSARLKELPKEYKISEEFEHRLDRTWKRISGRQSTIPAANFLEFFVEYNKHYTGEFPFDQTSILGMLHPVRGHLTRLPCSLQWQQFLHFLQLESLASFERQKGQQLPAKQICVYNLWKLMDTTGYLDFPRFLQLLHAMHISPISTFEDLKKELAWTLRDLPTELTGMHTGKAALRFELARRLFLERNE